MIEQTIDDFRGLYRWLSNFHMVSVTFEGEVYPSTEHAYQAAKSLDPLSRAIIRRLPRPMEAKRTGSLVKLREDWEEVKFEIMLALTREKYKHPDLAQALIATGDRELVEGNYWHDTYWGVCDGRKCRRGPHAATGENNLGKILMQVRAEITPKETSDV